jgi:predicted aspartyl protease
MDANELNADIIPQLLTLLGYTAVPVRQNIAGQLIIDAAINDVAGTYLLDTGAGTTVIDAKRAEKLKMKLNQEDAVLTGGGVGAHGMENIPSYNNTIQIADFKIKDLAVAVMSLDTAWQSLASVGAHDELFGFIGFDILKSGNAIIDYGTMTLYLIQQQGPD